MKMKYYNIRIQVDFDKPRDMAPTSSDRKPWRSVGYFQTFFCSESSKEKAKHLACEYYKEHEVDSSFHKFRFEMTVWMRLLTKLDQLNVVEHDLTEQMFDQRHSVGIWYVGSKEHYVSDEDYYASMTDDDL